jgi:hypothetical protein
MKRQITDFSRSISMRALALGVASALAIALPGNAYSQSAPSLLLQVQADDQGASQRIDLSGKLRMLSQRVVAAACYVQSGILVDESKAMLEATITEFGTITNALEFGDGGLGITGAEERGRTLAGINKINEVWAPVEALGLKISQGSGTQDDLIAMSSESAVVLDIAQRLTAQISGQYTNPNAMSQADALAVDIAGRQRMLAQRISKNTCLVTAGVDVAAMQTELQGASDTFYGSLNALSNGLASVGIQPPPNGDIATGLAVVADKWKMVEPIVVEALAGDTITDAALETMFTAGNTLTGEMNKVVGMYVDAAGYDS